ARAAVGRGATVTVRKAILRLARRPGDAGGSAHLDDLSWDVGESLHASVPHLLWREGGGRRQSGHGTRRARSATIRLFAPGRGPGHVRARDCDLLPCDVALLCLTNFG